MRTVVLEAVDPCIDCGNPNGAIRSRKNGTSYVVRIGGRCRTCYRRHRAELDPATYKHKRDTSRPKLIKKSRGLLNPPKISVRHFLSSGSAETEAVTDHEKRVRSMKWVQEYRRCRKGWDRIKTRCSEQIQAMYAGEAL